MLLVPDARSAFIDPVLEVNTLDLICDVVDPITREPYSRDPRYIAKKAEAFLPTTGIATVSYWGPEINYYIFNSLRFDQGMNYGFYYIDSEENLERGRDVDRPNLAHRPHAKEAYFPVPPMDKLQDVRSEIVRKLIDAGVHVEVHHHEVGTAGQLEEVLDALDADRDFLLRGDVFTEDLIDTYLAFKRDSAKQVALRPHPYEFFLYSDVSRGGHGHARTEQGTHAAARAAGELAEAAHGEGEGPRQPGARGVAGGGEDPLHARGRLESS